MRKKVINILLVEDDILDQMEVRRTLDKRNIVYRLTIANTGEDALESLKEVFEKPDIILLDLNMPTMSGFEVASVIRGSASWKDVKIFMLTSSDAPADKRTAKAIGISGFITKPLKLDSPSSLDAFNLMMDLMNG